MNVIAYPFLLLAGLGLLLSLTAHVLALFGKTIPGGGLVWTLHIGIFLVWIPAIILSRRMLRDVRREHHMETVLAACPRWLRLAIKIIFVYGILNFFLFMASTMGHPKPTGTAPPAVIRGFSGHWMIFYGAAFVTFYATIRSAYGGSRCQDSRHEFD